MQPSASSARSAISRNDCKLRARRNPVWLAFSPSPWRAAGYLASYLIVSVVLFSVAVSTGAVALSLSITIAALPLLVAAAAVIRGCAATLRLMLRQVFAEPVRARYPEPQGSGLWRQARARWGEGTTWRDLACLVGLWPALFTLATAAVAIWATLLAGITVPVWYWAIRGSCVGYCQAKGARGILIGSYPHGVHGPGASGLYVHTLPTALLTAAGFAVLFLLFNYVLVAAARAHGQLIRAVLRSPADPLAPALSVLTRPGPLGPLLRTGYAGPEPSGPAMPASGSPDR